MLPTPEKRDNRLSIWLLRLLMAVLLCFGAEILLWIDPPGRSLTDWLLLVVGYIALGAMMLDLGVRFRIRDLYDGMTLTALYAMAAGLLLNPQIALVDFPITFLTRIMGAHSLLGLEMFGLFLVLTGGNNPRARRLLLGFSLWVGFYWGIWVRWTPSLTDWLADEVALTTMFGYAGLILAIVLLVFVIVIRHAEHLASSDLQLSPNSWIGLGVVFAGLLGVRISQDAFDPILTVVASILIVFCSGILWFRRPTKGAMLFDAYLPPSPLPWLWIGGSLSVFISATVIAYHLPLIDIAGFNQLSVMGLGYTGLGLLWLPVVAAVVSINALDRLERQSRF